MSIGKLGIIAALFLLALPGQGARAEGEMDKTAAATHHYLHRKGVHAKNYVRHTGAHVHNYAHRKHQHARQWLNTH